MYKFAFIAITTLAIFLRTINLSEVPKSLSMDEVTFGYAAFSVQKTLHDETGNFLPLTFRGMGDYKPPVDVYLKIPFIFFFGLNETSVRLPGALLGGLSVPLLVLILRRLNFQNNPSLFGGFWLAISHWHVIYSRAGYEAVTALFFLLLAIYSFLSWTKKQSTLMFGISFAAFSLSVWSYHAERVYVPLFFATLIYFHPSNFKKFILKTPKLKLGILAILFLTLSLPFIYSIANGHEVLKRGQDLLFVKEIEREKDLYVLLHQFAKQYLAYFDPKFVFWSGLGLTPIDLQDIGILYLSDLPILIFGVVFLIKSKNKYLKLITLLLLLLGPLPGAFTRGLPSPVRILLWVPLFGIVMAAGLRALSKSKYKFIYPISLTLNVLYFLDIYLYQFPRYNADLWHYGYKEVSEYVCANQRSYDKIIITDKYGIEFPKINTIPHYYILFHCKVDPAHYQKNPELEGIELRQPQWLVDSKLENTLLVGSPWDFPESFDEHKIMSKLYFPNGKPAFYFVETGNETIQKAQ